MKIAVFGGSFDPVHFGHIEIVQGLVGSDYDKVIVVPTFVSPFKSEDGTTANAKHREEMLKLAFMDFLLDQSKNARTMADFIRAGNLIISDLEVSKKKVSYTYDTIVALKKEYPGAELDFVIGWDCVPSLDKWKNFDELKKLTNFLVVKRGQESACDDIFLSLQKKDIGIRIAPFEVSDISSSYVRVLGAFEKIGEVVPNSVAGYIKEHELYQCYRYLAKRHIEAGLAKERTEHSLRVTEDAINLAKINGVRIGDAIVSALLHDIAKAVTLSEMAESGLLSADKIEEIDKLPDAVRHAWIGAWVVEYLMELSPQIAEAIKFHTTGAPNMSKLAKIIYLSDYIEKGRPLKDLPEIRKVVYNNLDDGMLVVLGLTLEHLKKTGGQVSELTKEAYDYYLAKQSAK